MSLPLWVTELVEEFWIEAGFEEALPRDLRVPIAWSQPLSIILLPYLRYGSIIEWLENKQTLCLPELEDRSLRACLVAKHGYGAIFIDGTDPSDEQRFSIAHELGHFLAHYRKPRAIASHRMGQDVLDVMDGLRAARFNEQVQSVVSGTEIGPHVHLLSREADGRSRQSAVIRAEHEADLVAYELLAPSEMVLRQVRDTGTPQALSSLLVETYGLPVREVRKYTRVLMPMSEPDISLLERLGLAP